MNARRSRGYPGSRGRYAPPALRMPRITTIISSDRGAERPTITPRADAETDEVIGELIGPLVELGVRERAGRGADRDGGGSAVDPGLEQAHETGALRGESRALSLVDGCQSRGRCPDIRALHHVDPEPGTLTSGGRSSAASTPTSARAAGAGAGAGARRDDAARAGAARWAVGGAGDLRRRGLARRRRPGRLEWTQYLPGARSAPG